jgi:hypothetical protein
MRTIEAYAALAAKKAHHVQSYSAFQDAYGAHLDNVGDTAEYERLDHLARDNEAAWEADGFTLADMVEGDQSAMEQRQQQS